MMTIPDLLKAKNLASKSAKLGVEVIRLKSQVEEAFKSELTFDISLKEITPETSANESKVECKPIKTPCDYLPPEHAFDGVFSSIAAIIKGNESGFTLKSSLPNIRVEGSEAALLIGYLYELKVKELNKVNAELNALGIEIP